MVEEDFSGGKPQFNIALGYTSQLLYSLHLCSEYSRMRDYNSWFHEQLVLYRWISTRMKGDSMNVIEGNGEKEGDVKDEEGDVKDDFTRMEKFIEEIEPFIPCDGNPKKSKELYMKLHRMEMFLRKTIKDANLEMKEEVDFLKPEEQW